MASFNNKKEAKEYAKRYKLEFDSFIQSQLLTKEDVYKRVDYYNLSEEQKRRVDKEIDEINNIIQSQFSVYSFPCKKKI